MAVDLRPAPGRRRLLRLTAATAGLMGASGVQAWAGRQRHEEPAFVGGDIHSFWTTDPKADFANPKSRIIATAFAGGAITADAPPYEPFAPFLPQNSHVKYFEGRAHGHVFVDVTPARMETRFVSVDRLQRDAAASTLAAFVGEDGKAGAVEA